MAFVQRGGELGWGGWVDSVDCVLPTMFKERGFVLIAWQSGRRGEGPTREVSRQPILYPLPPTWP